MHYRPVILQRPTIVYRLTIHLKRQKISDIGLS